MTRPRARTRPPAPAPRRGTRAPPPPPPAPARRVLPRRLPAPPRRGWPRPARPRSPRPRPTAPPAGPAPPPRSPPLVLASRVPASPARDQSSRPHLRGRCSRVRRVVPASRYHARRRRPGPGGPRSSNSAFAVHGRSRAFLAWTPPTPPLAADRRHPPVLLSAQRSDHAGLQAHHRTSERPGDASHPLPVHHLRPSAPPDVGDDASPEATIQAFEAAATARGRLVAPTAADGAESTCRPTGPRSSARSHHGSFATRSVSSASSPASARANDHDRKNPHSPTPPSKKTVGSPAACGPAGTAQITLLNVPGRHLWPPASTPRHVPLRIAKLLQSMVEVVAEVWPSWGGWAEGGLADLQGTLLVGAGAGHIAEVDQQDAEPAMPSSDLGVVGTRSRSCRCPAAAMAVAVRQRRPRDVSRGLAAGPPG
jgi:hypothetical protein